MLSILGYFGSLSKDFLIRLRGLSRASSNYILMLLFLDSSVVIPQSLPLSKKLEKNKTKTNPKNKAGG